MLKTGRPKGFDEKKRELLCGLIGIGFTRRQAAQHVGVSNRTVVRALHEDAEFSRRLHNAELNQELRPIQHIASHMPKNWRAAAWMLERQRPDLYVRRAPETVSLGDLRGIFGGVMKLLLEGVPEQGTRDRVRKNVESFLIQLGGRQRCSPRVRRVLDSIEQDRLLPASETSSQVASEPSGSGQAMASESKPGFVTTEVPKVDKT